MKIKVLVLLVLIVFTSCKKENKNTHCFKDVIENNVTEEGKQIVEINELVLNVVIDDEKISGNFDYYPHGDKANLGKFTGTIKDNVATTICEFDQEGNVKKEEVIFKIEEGKVSILGGEKEEKDGIWKFKDPSKGFYMNEIPRIDCN